MSDIKKFFKADDAAHKGIYHIEFLATWIKNNASVASYNKFINRLREFVGQCSNGKLVRNLNSGMQVWDVKGLAILISDYCVQERNNGYDVRTLVFLEDGHLYTSWNSKASILF